MISRRTVFEIHQLQAKGFSCRSIARQLQIDRETVTKYLADPEPSVGQRKTKLSKFDPYHDLIKEMVEECQDVKAPVILQRIREKGFYRGDHHCPKSAPEVAGYNKESAAFYPR